ncbi:hypothetical protein D3C71_2245110 [compost metagenome]
MYVADSPAAVQVLPEYAGCRSWIELNPSPAAGSWHPVLDDEEFRHRVDEIKAAMDH